MSQFNVVDSSGWLEYFVNTPRAGLFEPAVLDTPNLLVPVISIYEVFKKVLRDRGEDRALRIASTMRNGRVIDLDLSLSIDAAKYHLPLADSIIYATAQRYNAVLWTQDRDLQHLPDVRYFPHG